MKIIKLFEQFIDEGIHDQGIHSLEGGDMT